MATRDALTFSPVEIRASNSRLFGSEPKDSANSIKRLVSPAIAETTTTGKASLDACWINLATAEILSVEPTEVPPNFNTMVSILYLNDKRLSEGLYDIGNRFHKFINVFAFTCALSKVISSAAFTTNGLTHGLNNAVGLKRFL